MKRKFDRIRLIEEHLGQYIKKIKLRESSLENDPLRAYIQTALWSSNDESDEYGGEPFDKNYDYEDVDVESIRQAKKDLGSFITRLKKEGLLTLYLQDYDLSQLAHDFWLTRNGHGAGFLDRYYSNDTPDGQDMGKVLTSISDTYRELTPILGDDGKIHFE